MKIGAKLLPFLTGLIALLFVSCATVGQHLPITSGENVLGTIQTTFAARDAWLPRKETMNIQVYIKLLEAAVQKYPGDIDIRDIVWVTGRKLNPHDTEISATGKVIKVGINETEN